MTLGEIIKEYRQSHGLSQDAIAIASGLSKAYISILERNRNPKTGEPPVASLKTIKAISSALGSDFDSIFSKLDPDIKVSISEQLPSLPSNALPYNEPHMAPIVGAIPAGYPALAFEEVEGYASIPYADAENYFFLRVSGESMINAGIKSGDLVLLRKQDCADDGQIVAARVNGDEATLKRFKRQGDMVLLLPENPAYDPRVVPAIDFETGEAGIIGVAVEVRHML